MGEGVFIKMKQLDFTSTQLVCYTEHKLSRKGGFIQILNQLS